MNVCSDSQFQVLRSGLTNRLLTTTKELLQDEGFAVHSVEKPQHGSVCLDQVSVELLTLGADVWPQSSCDEQHPKIVSVPCGLKFPIVSLRALQIAAAMMVAFVIGFLIDIDPPDAFAIKTTSLVHLFQPATAVAHGIHSRSE